MADDRFDRLTVAVAHRATRRAILALLSALGLGALSDADALADCADNGTPCLRSDDCCSGLCKKKRNSRKKYCRAAPGQGVCTIASDYCGGGGVSSCGSGGCECARRANGASVCAFPPGLICSFKGDCTNAKCRAALNDKTAFCGMSRPDNVCCTDKKGVCYLPCDNPA